jgi:hypothetical protein
METSAHMEPCIRDSTNYKNKGSDEENHGTLLKLNTMPNSHTFLKHLSNVSTKAVNKRLESEMIKWASSRGRRLQ